MQFFGTKGAAEHAFPMYTLADAMRLKDHVLERWEAADRDPSLADDGALNIVVVGGGPTGVETAGALAELYRADFASDYKSLAGAEARIVARRGRPGALPDVQAQAARLHGQGAEEADGRGHDRRQGRVRLADPGDAALGRGARGAHARLGCRAAGQRTVESLGIELERGNRIAVGPDLTLPDHPEVFVVGDVAAITDTKTQQVLPQLGSVALQSGEHAGESIARRIAGKAAEAVRLPRQGNDGGDRPQARPSCRCSAGGR